MSTQTSAYCAQHDNGIFDLVSASVYTPNPMRWYSSTGGSRIMGQLQGVTERAKLNMHKPVLSKTDNRQLTNQQSQRCHKGSSTRNAYASSYNGRLGVKLCLPEPTPLSRSAFVTCDLSSCASVHVARPLLTFDKIMNMASSRYEMLQATHTGKLISNKLFASKWINCATTPDQHLIMRDTAPSMPVRLSRVNVEKQLTGAEASASLERQRPKRGR
eukprot:363888-Chlamydomonas_euryale.AAC.2